MEIIDSYSHCGQWKYQPIEQVCQVLEAAGVSRAVLVQHLGETDNSYIQQAVASNPWRFVGVCLIDHRSSTANETLQQWNETGRFRGVRFTTEVLAEAPQMFSAAWELGLLVVLFAPNGLVDYVGLLDPFLQQRPNAQLVITHLGNPDPRQGPQFDAQRSVLQLAQYPGVYYQLSGMKMFCHYPYQELYPLISQAVESFGPERLLWGSNYPVVSKTKDYQQELQLLIEGHLPVPKEAIPSIAGENARQLWFDNAKS